MHSCPECDQACYCGGDIDDVDVGDDEAAERCTHCAEGDRNGDDEFEPYESPRYLCCGRKIEDGHADSCMDRVEGDYL
jgi:hypothetical protein